MIRLNCEWSQVQLSRLFGRMTALPDGNIRRSDGITLVYREADNSLTIIGNDYDVDVAQRTLRISTDDTESVDSPVLDSEIIESNAQQH